MIDHLNKLEENRKALLSKIEHLTPEQYNEIPEGFSNNVIWNLGHILLSGEGMLYKNSPFERPELELNKSNYGRGSKPGAFVSEDEINLIRESMLRSVQFYKAAAGLDQSIEGAALTIAPSVQIISEESIQFLFFHEEMHYNKISKLIEKVS